MANKEKAIVNETAEVQAAVIATAKLAGTPGYSFSVLDRIFTFDADGSLEIDQSYVEFLPEDVKVVK